MDEITVFDKRVEREVQIDELVAAIDGGFAPHFGWKSIRMAR